MFYKLDKNNKPILCSDYKEYLEWSDNNLTKTIGRDTIGDVLVSTVFLGIGYGRFGSDLPELWETMIFEGEHDNYQERYTSYEDAVKGHAKAVNLVKNQ